MSESEKDITTSNEVEYLTDIFQTEDGGDSGKSQKWLLGTVIVCPKGTGSAWDIISLQKLYFFAVNIFAV